ncbi:hypothetical protein [Streptomyces purpurogeneiscleroticus]|uniref:hypothetical protein n=1 Tax=Streptomyces purpurogeneiscleroticus TaxID=68259 RepID=UPI001CC0AD04|nr:hypothetical protein [Streptomyces purpurogeneiscleroticus]
MAEALLTTMLMPPNLSTQNYVGATPGGGDGDRRADAAAATRHGQDAVRELIR